MKTYLFLIIFVLNSGLLFSQNLSGVLKYRFIYSFAGQERDIPCFLYFNAQKSLFDYDKLAYKELKDSLEVNVSMGDKPAKRKRDAHGQMYLMDKTKGMLYFREFVFLKPYISSEPIPVISWQLKNEVKTIAGYVCKKAEASFRGRKYTVWYTSSIPVSVGPWKLQGLPGAILEAETEDKEVKFVVESIRIPADEVVEKVLQIDQLPDGKIVTFEGYLQAFDKESKEEAKRMGTIISALEERAKQEGKLPSNFVVSSPNSFMSAKMFRIEKYE